MKISAKKIIICFLIHLVVIGLKGQKPILQHYIKLGLENNLALKQVKDSSRLSTVSLKKARALFFPDLSFNARYTVADGGRVFEIPVGTLLNPAYRTLNQLSAIHGIPSDLPENLKNQEFPLYRPKEQWTHLSLVQPLFNPEIYYNYKINTTLNDIKETDIETYKRDLVAEIKKAYFNYLKASENVGLLNNTRHVLEENLRVNKKLYNQNKQTIDKVYRSEAELSGIDQKIAEAIKYKKTAAAYFNFLINRDLEADIEATDEYTLKINSLDVEQASNKALNSREELFILDQYEKISQQYLKLNRSKQLPTIAASVDYGFQGEKYEFTRDQDFIMASVILRWQLFKGFDNRLDIQEARIINDIAKTRQQETEQKIRHQVINVYYELEAAHKKVIAAEKQVSSSKKSFAVINKKYELEQASLLEFIDARNNLTKAEQNLNIATYDYHIIYTDFERVTCSYVFNE